MMRYTRLEGIKPELSRLVYGTPGAACGTHEEAYDCFETAFQMGFRVFDTANSYGRSEENLGWWLAHSGHREEIALFDKGFNPTQNYAGNPDVYSADTIRAQLRLSLERLQTDHVDFYVLHRDDPDKGVEEIIDVLNEYRDKGMIGRFGASNWRWDRVCAANDYAAQNGLEGFSVLSPCYSLADLVRDPWGGSVTISGAANAKIREAIADSGLPVFPYSALSRGYFSGKLRTDDPRPVEEILPYAPVAEYHSKENFETLRRAETLAKEKGCAVSTVALAWLLARPMNIFPIVAPTGEKHIRDALDAFELCLTEEELCFLKP